MTEGGRANCCLYWEKAFNKGDGTIPSHHIRNKGGGGRGRKRTTGQKSYREMNSSAMHSQFKSSVVWQGQRHEHEMFPGQRAGNPVQVEVFVL